MWSNLKNRLYENVFKKIQFLLLIFFFYLTDSSEYTYFRSTSRTLMPNILKLIKDARQAAQATSSETPDGKVREGTELRGNFGGDTAGTVRAG